MKPRHGSVWYEDQRVGGLRSDRRGILYFCYAPEWLSGGFPISLQLPLSLGENEVNAHGFFQGLLPEGRSRLAVCRQLRIDPDDDAALLFAIGEDCAGALSIVSGEELPDEGQKGLPAELSAEEVTRIIDSRGAASTEILGESRRFSLAGAQEKLPVIVEGDRFFRPDRLHPSSHILKFETVQHVCFAEYATLELARKLGLEVVDCRFRSSDNRSQRPCLLIERYDRYRDDAGTLHRLHQEDFIQALGYETMVKYEEDGGPGLADVFESLREHSPTPIPETGRVLDWQIFNYLSGNFDGHGKNLALLYGQNRALPVLAPFYDLVSIDFLNKAANANYTRTMAFYVGGEGEPERIGREAWRTFAREIGYRAPEVERRLLDMSDRMPAAAKRVREEFADRFGDKAVYDQFERVVARRCNRTVQIMRGKG